MITLLSVLVLLALEYLIVAGLFWVACWALGMLGITLVWTWGTAFAVFILVELIRIIF